MATALSREAITVTPQRLAAVGAVAVLSVSIACLAGWQFLWRILMATNWPPALHVMPLTALACAMAAVALLLVLRDAPRVRSRGLAAGVIAIGGVVLLQYLLGLAGGLEQYLFAEQASALLGGTHPGRPAPQSALAMLFVGLALWFLSGKRAYRYDFADLGIGLALFLSFMVLMGHLFQAPALYHSAGGGRVGMSVVETLLVLGLSLSALCLNPQGVVANFVAEGAVGAAKRRTVPVIVIVPAGLALLQYWLVEIQALDSALALALMVTANIVVFLALTEWISRFMVRLEEQRTGIYVQREVQAKQEGMTDMLTQLRNRRGWDQDVREAEARCRNENLNACVIVIDLDGLKRVNDTEGHAKGDEFIRRAGNALRTAARRDDILARLGGDEFACLSVGCVPEHANEILKRLSTAMAKANVPASLGFAMRDLAGSIAAAFQEADQAMYRHKRARKAARTEKPAQTSGS
jgi:diguanylate cyclase (GGDEF)-like protein